MELLIKLDALLSNLRKHIGEIDLILASIDGCLEPDEYLVSEAERLLREKDNLLREYIKLIPVESHEIH
jgi:hypothetical protein